MTLRSDLVVQNFFSRGWQALALRGLFGIAFGLAALFVPRVLPFGLAVTFGAYALIDGVAAILAAGWQRDSDHVFAMMLDGLVGFSFGLTALMWPATAQAVLVALVALWAILTGLLEVIAAVRLRRVVPGEVWLGVAGTVSLLFGLLLANAPPMGAGVFVSLLGAYALVFGATTLVFALRLRSLSATAPLDSSDAAFALERSSPAATQRSTA